MVADEIFSDFVSQEVDKVEIIYTKFVSLIASGACAGQGWVHAPGAKAADACVREVIPLWSPGSCDEVLHGATWGCRSCVHLHIGLPPPPHSPVLRPPRATPQNTLTQNLWSKRYCRCRPSAKSATWMATAWTQQRTRSSS